MFPRKVIGFVSDRKPENIIINKNFKKGRQDKAKDTCETFSASSKHFLRHLLAVVTEG